MINQDIKIADAHKKRIGKRFIWWRDENDWQCRVSLHFGEERGTNLIIVSGSSSDECPGYWANEDIRTTHMADGIDEDYVVKYAEFVNENFIGDPRVMEAIRALLKTYNPPEIA